MNYKGTTIAGRIFLTAPSLLNFKRVNISFHMFAINYFKEELTTRDWFIFFAVIIVFLIIMEIYYKHVVKKCFETNNSPEKIIEYGERLKTPRPIDHYRIGSTYLVHYRNPTAASQHFTKALQKVVDTPAATVAAQAHNTQIIDGIADYRRELPYNAGMQALIQRAYLEDARARTELIRDDARPIPAIAREVWVADSQNVHDSKLFDDFQTQFNRVRYENVIADDAYANARSWLLTRANERPADREKIEKVFRILDNNYELTGSGGARENDVLAAVWTRAHDPRNKDRAAEIKEAVYAGVLDCHEPNGVVCLAGRSPKIWQSLALLDVNPEIGVLKTKQLMRNEIYGRCAQIVQQTLGDAPARIKEAYDKGEDSADVRALSEQIRSKLDLIAPEYDGAMPAKRVKAILDECKATV
jgi:hypothetical protein